MGAVDDLQTAIVATGAQFADALAGGPLATGGEGAGVLPVLLVGDDVPAATSDAIEDLGIEQVIILGGSGAVSGLVEAELESQTGNAAVRLAGVNRFSTAVAVAEFALDTLEFPGTEALLANGLNFADALAGGPLGGVRQAPMLLTPTQPLDPDTEAFFEEHADTIETITSLGGTAAVTDSTAQTAETAAETATETESNQDITVAPAAAADAANGTGREYTATGLGTSIVDIALVRCATVQRGSDGTIRFTNANANTIADGTSNASESNGNPDDNDSAAAITEINGSERQREPVTANDDYADDVTPTNGTVTFTVSGPSSTSSASECVIPVVFVDEDSDDGLDGAATNPTTPIEAFGVGGATTFSPAAAGNGTFDVEVDDSQDASNRFVGCTIVDDSLGEDITDPEECLTYHYDAADTFQVNNVTVSLESFEIALTQGDDVRSGNYSATPNTRSTFSLYEELAPEPPSTSALAEPETTSNSVEITYTDSERPTTDSYRLFRAAGADPCPHYTVALYTRVADEPDEVPGSFQPLPPQTITDRSSSLQPSTTYCYVLVSVDDLDEGPPTDPVAARTAAAGSTTTASPTAGAPRITAATANTADATDPTLSNGDQHRLTFSEPMADSTAEGSYTVNEPDSQLPGQPISCGLNADCVLSEDRTVLGVTITSGLVAPLSYPLQIVSASGMTDAGGTAVDVANSSDDLIERVGPLDESGPKIIAADMTTDPGADGFKAAGDAMDLTFDEPVWVDDADNLLTEAQVDAILGSSAGITYAQSLSVRVTAVSATVLRLTVEQGKSLSAGPGIGTPIPGSNNNDLVQDLFGNNQESNSSAAALTA